jgi:UDP-N-acetylmuramoylalanine--D-glutamate ligase
MQIQGKNIVILGAGESGVGAAILAKTKGAKTFVSDFGMIKSEYKTELVQYEIAFEENTHSLEIILNADLLIKSPGIPEKAPIMIAIREKGIKVISEIEFGAYFTTAKKICITGSNGKTTTTMLTHHMLKKAGLKVGLAGNVGYSFAKQVALENYEVFVLELSSFQLEDMMDFKADISMILNISPDHLDRYDYDMQKYVDAKFRILNNQNQNDFLIYNLDDPTIVAEIQKRLISAKLLPFSLLHEVEEGAYIKNKQLTINFKNQFTMSIHEMALKGKHNMANSLAASLAGRILEIRNETIRESMSDFVNVEHRLEFVAKINGVEFINDSKATNINSTWFALESMENPTVWIVGGVDKGNDYTELLELVKDKVKAIVCLGSDNQKIKETFENMVEMIVETNSALEAVMQAKRLSKAGDTVLLSPACASFDLFENYEDRGNKFKEAVRAI